MCLEVCKFASDIDCLSLHITTQAGADVPTYIGVEVCFWMFPIVPTMANLPTFVSWVFCQDVLRKSDDQRHRGRIPGN
jgi:hypothetical protein